MDPKPPQNEDTMDNVCSICLDSLYECDFTSSIGEIVNCRHIYHDVCIKEWANRSNSCPTCRELFHEIHIINRGELVASLKVQDKLLPNDAINDIPREFIIPSPLSVPSEPNEYGVNAFATCVLCANNSSNENMICCDSCSCNFHSNCLAIGYDVLEWVCPMCDSTQDSSSMRQAPAPRRRPRRTVARSLMERNSRITNDFFLQSRRRSPVARLVATRHSRLSSSGAMFPPKPPTPAPEASVEEDTAWDDFEKAKNSIVYSMSDFPQQTGSSSASLAPAGEPKKLKKPSRRAKDHVDPAMDVFVSSNVPSVPSVSEPNSTKISSIINEMKGNWNKQKQNKKVLQNQYDTTIRPILNTHFFGQVSPPISPTQLPVNLSLSSDMMELDSPNPNQHLSPSPRVQQAQLAQSFPSPPPPQALQLQQSRPIAEIQGQSANIPAQNELSFDNKQLIQHHIRGKLTPLYKSNALSYDQYTSVNKKISRSLYSYLVAHLEVFDNEQSLVGIINDHVDTQLRSL